MKIAITTPTGNVGSQLLPQLVRAGVRPIVLVRDAAALDEQARSRCDIVELDQADAEAVAAATSGVDALYWVDPPTDDEDPLDGYRRMTDSVAHAVRANGIPRVVFQSSVGAEARTGFGEIDGLAGTEAALDATGASVTHLRNGYFFTNLMLDIESIRAGELTTTLPVDQRIPWVAPLDIATTGAARLLSTAWSGRHTLGVHGPADLSFAEVASVISDATGQPVSAREVPESEVAEQLAQFGMTPARIEAILGMTRGLRGRFVPEDPRTVETTTPTTLASWAFDNLRPALAGP